jgi:hypothetical protein
VERPQYLRCHYYPLKLVILSAAKDLLLLLPLLFFVIPAGNLRLAPPKPYHLNRVMSLSKGQWRDLRISGH